MAANALTPREGAGPTAILSEISRRGLLSGALTVGAVVATVGAGVAASAPTDPDALFWERHREYKALLAEYAAQPSGMTDAQGDRWHKRIVKAEGELMATQPHSIAVISAKYAITGGEEMDYGKGWTSLDVIGWDLERLATKGMFPSGYFA